MRSMKAVVINEFGGREVLKYVDMPIPEPGEGEVLVRVRAAGVNPVDWKIRAGHLKDFYPYKFPVVLGWDLAGVVEKVGYSARRFKSGDEVYAYCRRPVIQHGTYAEYVAIPETYIAHRPKTVSFEEAAAVPLAGLTAYQSVYDTVKLRAGESILILGASGGVGGFGVQFAKIAGAKVVAVASKKNHAYLKELGADEAVNYASGDFRSAVKSVLPHGADVVFDCFGPEGLTKGYDCVKRGGRVVSILVRENRDLAAKAGAVHHYVFVEPNVVELDHIRSLVEGGKLRVHLSSVHPLADVAKAQEEMETGHTRGKIILRM
jgi:NADPH:quinone reductase-like Zn-dependent oxidoreductase